jgi:hypothetical protein
MLIQMKMDGEEYEQREAVHKPINPPYKRAQELARKQ